MTKAIAERVAELAAALESYQASYYTGTAEISDAEFDALWDELARLDPQHPRLLAIGSDLVDGFAKVKHLMPMGSQDKAATEAEFRAWAAKIAPEYYMVQYKLDGASLELQYRGGRLRKAVTRGDGLVGDDISANARRMGGCLAVLDQNFTGSVRAEVLMACRIKAEKYPEAANCRNAANGVMRRKDGQGAEDLDLICYDVLDSENPATFPTESAKINWLKDRGFKTPVSDCFKEAEAIIAYRQRVAELRPGLPYDIDGLVVKDDRTDVADLRRPRPERQIAFKFDLEEAISTLIAVEWSESGSTYTPIGLIDPVSLAGTTVQRANLNNPSKIKAMGLYLGAKVVVVKRGEIIPKIERLADDVPNDVEPAAIPQPTICSSCGSALVDAGTRLYCPNLNCPKRLHHRLEKWIAVLEIREFGERLLGRLFELNRLSRVADLYSLTVEELAALDRMGELSAAKVIKNLRAPRRLPLAQFVAGFDIDGVGQIIMEKVVAAGFNTLLKLRQASLESLSQIHGLGEITALAIIEGLAENLADMEAVLASGYISLESPVAGEARPLATKSFCFTGELASMKRAEAAEQVKALGGLVRDSVTKDLSFLVTNDPYSGSAKNQKARKLAIPILDEAGFLALLQAKFTLETTAAPNQADSPNRAEQGELFNGVT